MSAERVARAEIVAVGDEMTHGRCIDTNSAWLAREIETCGLAVARIHVVCDAQDEIAAVLREAGARADWVVVTGGLGPTLDDRTRDAAAAAAGVDLVHDEAAWQAILGWFARVGRRNVPESNRRQALFPRGAEVLANDRGTAPGFVLRIGRARVAVLPGVPAEMKAMFSAAVAPRLVAAGGSRSALALGCLQVLGPSEAALGERLAPFMTDGRNPAVGITVTHGMLTVRVAARAAEPGEAQALCARELDVLRDLLGAEVVGEGDAPLQETLVGVLRARGLRLAVAESCTAGMLLSALGDVPGVSAVLAGGVVSYADEVKVRDLDVPADVLAAHGAVSEPVAAAMAAGAARRFGVPVALSVTGIAGPDGGTPDKPVGTVCFATAVEGTVVPFTRRFADLGREFIRRRSVLEAMAALLRRLRG
ncbi:MAG TPA: competence/damage-inducible protein A [Planctomycetota bacterium]|nr:competence/damage-inducible protein A [Planctomycetota bacterium]